MSATQQIAAPFQTELDRGVLVVSVPLEALARENALYEFQEGVIEQLASGESAVLVDCRRLVGKASTGFLASLVAIRRHASRLGLFVGVCGLKGPMREAFDISCLDQIITTYANRESALLALGEFDADERASLKVSGRATAADDDQAESPSFRERLGNASAGDPMVKLLVVAAGVVAVAAMLAVGAWQFLGSSQTQNVTSAPFFETTVPAPQGGITFTGQITKAGTGVAGALVIAWPIQEYANKIDPSVVHQYINAGAVGVMGENIYATVSLSNGTFQLRIGEPGMYNVLVVSQDQGERKFRGDDLKKIGERFTDAQALVQGRQYKLQYRKMNDEDELSVQMDVP